MREAAGLAVHFLDMDVVGQAVEEQRADIDILAAGGDLLGDVRFGTAGWTPDHGRLADLHQQSQGLGKLARVQRVVGGDGIGVGRWELQTSGSRGWNASRRSDPRPLPSLAFLLGMSGQEPAERIKRLPRDPGLAVTVPVLFLGRDGRVGETG